MLQGLSLPGRSGKLINLGKGIYYQDENFACTFFTVAKKSAFSRKKYADKCQSAPQEIVGTHPKARSVNLAVLYQFLTVVAIFL